jgi:uncharacterized protein
VFDGRLKTRPFRYTIQLAMKNRPMHLQKNGGTILADNRSLAPPILEIVNDWAKSQESIHGLALVGSHARNATRPDSDIDFVFLSKNPNDFRSAAWLTGLEWSRAGAHLAKWADEEYGVVWSRRIWLKPDFELDVVFAPLSWAGVSPVDKGTERVVSDGCRVLYDPAGLFDRLKLAVARR